eukprot:564724_1
MRNRHKGKEEEIHHQNENNKLLMEWTSKQGRILTANGKAASYYTAARGFPYIDADLPHHHLMNNSTTDTFLAWAKEREVRLQSQSQSLPHSHSHSHSQGEHQHPDVKTHYPICGAFNRPLFVGGWEHSTDQEEDVFNVQTNTLFIDIRIPKLGRGRSMMKHGNNNNASTSASASIRKGLGDLNDEELKLYARRHAFAGYTKLDTEATTVDVTVTGTATGSGVGAQVSLPVSRCVCTRHHCIDWNFTGTPRNRPNKWYVEMEPTQKKIWKELAYAKDDFGQHYYSERWERYERDGMGNGFVVALRRDKKDNENDPNFRDGIIVAVGDHFNYIFGRNEALIDTLLSKTKKAQEYKAQGNTVGLIDVAIDNGDRELAEEFLSIDAGHGSISNGWKIDASTQPWKEGTSLCGLGSGGTHAKVLGQGSDSKILIGDYRYTILESNVTANVLTNILDGVYIDIDSRLLDNKRQPAREDNATKKRKPNPDE